MEHIGYSLIDAGGAELQYWGDQTGRTRGRPDYVRLPTGEHVNGMTEAWSHPDGYRLVERWMDNPPTPYHAAQTQNIAYANNRIEVTRPWVLTEAALDTMRSEYKSRVDADAESCRLTYITPGDGMAMTYQEKFAQAQAVAAMGAAAADALTQAERETQFPTLSASVGIEAPTLSECADLVLAKYAAFAQLSLVIERTRLQGKAAISAASDGAAVVAAYEALSWPTPQS